MKVKIINKLTSNTYIMSKRVELIKKSLNKDQTIKHLNRLSEDDNISLEKLLLDTKKDLRTLERNREDFILNPNVNLNDEFVILIERIKNFENRMETIKKIIEDYA